ncbi:MAG: HAD family hydrolase [Saccharofermentanales bacterium]
MRKPEMIIFDYGETLFTEEYFDGVKGTKAVLESCVKNPKNISAEEIQDFANELNNDFGRYDPKTRHLVQFEIHNHQFQNYLYEHFGLKRTVSPLELETVFWDAACPAKPTDNIVEFLEYLKSVGIRSSVISNISMSGEALSGRINRLIPENNFEFILASSEYIFRKPHRRIFELAAIKAGIAPEDIWYCGDNPFCDIDGARNAGMTPIWYKGGNEIYKNEPQDECITINDWLELKRILTALDCSF